MFCHARNICMCFFSVQAFLAHIYGTEKSSPCQAAIIPGKNRRYISIYIYRHQKLVVISLFYTLFCHMQGFLASRKSIPGPPARFCTSALSNCGKRDPTGQNAGDVSQNAAVEFDISDKRSENFLKIQNWHAPCFYTGRGAEATRLGTGRQLCLQLRRAPPQCRKAPNQATFLFWRPICQTRNTIPSGSSA